MSATRGTAAGVTQATHAAIATVWRLEAAKVIASVARITHDVGVAEEGQHVVLAHRVQVDVHQRFDDGVESPGGCLDRVGLLGCHGPAS